MKKILTICCLLLLVYSCDEDVDLNPNGFTEIPVNINGSWTVERATQNGNDITSKLDFQTFTLNLNYEGDQPTTFNIPSFNVPFGIDFSSGTWMFDDLTYPTKLIFNSNSGTSSSLELLTIPLSSEATNFNLQFDLGCGSNTYIYSFRKN